MIDMERMYKYMNLLESKRFITSSECMAEMEISYATFKRDLAVLRSRFDVPIVYDREFFAYRLDHNHNKKRLPGIWFNSREIQIFNLLKEQIEKFESPHLCREIEELKGKLERACQNTN